MMNYLKSLADKYECASFCDEDPSQFLRWYKDSSNAQTASFIAAMLSFGSRTQFIPKITQILQTADNSAGSINRWLTDGTFKTDFPTGSKKFYRFYSFDDMQTFFEEFAQILRKARSLGDFFCSEYERAGALNVTEPLNKTPLPDLISSAFPKSKIVPKGKNSANKRIHMFLRWMVRQNSPVDLGLWKWYPQSKLIIPLDVHVMQESVKLGLLPPDAKATRKTAVLLTQKMNQIFPDDPCRADYALFGLGVD